MTRPIHKGRRWLTGTDITISDKMLAKMINSLTSEIGITDLQARVYLYVTCNGKADAETIADRLDAPVDDAYDAAEMLVTFGAFIEMYGEYEATHPRFGVVNMLRRVCEFEHVRFSRNPTLDAIGAALESPYDAARTK